MMTSPIIFIICGVHNGLEYTKKLLKCLKQQTYIRTKIIIIDDDSTDGTSLYLTKNYPDIMVLKGDGNLWWTGAIYWGVEEVFKYAKSNDFVLTVNNDCVFDKAFIKTLVDVSQANQRAIVGSLVLDINKRDIIWDGGIKINWKKATVYGKRLKNITEIPARKTMDKDIDTLTTKGTLYPVEVFNKIGNFDKIHLPHYLSDYEFACRAKQAGFPLVLSYQAKVYNDTVRTGLGDTMPKIISYSQWWQLLFNRKSRINIIDQYLFIRLCCPRRYLIQNYFFLIMKFFYLLSFTFPFIIFRPLAVCLRRNILKPTIHHEQ